MVITDISIISHKVNGTKRTLSMSAILALTSGTAFQEKLVIRFATGLEGGQKRRWCWSDVHGLRKASLSTAPLANLPVCQSRASRPARLSRSFALFVPTGVKGIVKDPR